LLAVGAYHSLASLGWTELMARRLAAILAADVVGLQPTHDDRRGENMRRIVFVLVAVGALAGVVAYMAPAFGQADREAAPIFGVKIPPDTAIGG
jgi:hypothetical protein